MLLQGLKKAFTMAEVLMVIAVIGITASLTLPQVNNGMEEKKVVAALRKIYPELQSAYQAVISKHGSPAEWTVPSGASTSSMMYNYLLQELSVAKSCGNGMGCFTSSSIDSSTDHYKMVLKDGAFLSLSVESVDNIQSSIANDFNTTYNGYSGDILIDVNGNRGKNEWGYDIFPFIIYNKDGIVPDGIDEGVSIEHPTAWVIKVGNRDYLKCDDLDWNTKRSCK